MKKMDFLLIGGFVLAMIGVNLVLLATNSLSWSGLWDWKTFGTMVAAAITVAVMSQLYKDNPLFKLAEHMFVGSALGYGLVITWNSMWVNEILPAMVWPVLEHGFKALVDPTLSKGPQLMGVWSAILPSLLGLLMYTRLSKKYAWLSRIPFAVMIGFGVGISIPSEITSKLLLQLKPMMVDMLHNPRSGQFAVQWDLVLIFIGVMSTLVYFFFSLEHKGAVGAVSRVGVWFLMIAFGASFGYTVQGRLSLLIGRISYLFKDWIPLIK